MMLLLIYLVAYLMAGAPTITGLEGWAVFGIVSIAAAFSAAIAESGGDVFVDLDPAAEDDIGL